MTRYASRQQQQQQQQQQLKASSATGSCFLFDSAAPAPATRTNNNLSRESSSSTSTLSTATARSRNSSRSSGAAALAVRFSLQSIQEDKDRYGHLSSFMVAADALHAAIDKAACNNGRRGEGEGGGGGGRRLVELSQAADGKDDHQSAHHGEFLNLLDSEIGRVSQTITSQLKDQELSARALLTAMDAEIMSGSPLEEQPVDEANAASTAYLRAKVHELSDLCLKLQAFVARNTELLKQVACRADAEEIGSSSSCLSYVNRRLAVSPWNEDGPSSALLIVLSDIYNEIRKIEGKHNKANDGIISWGSNNKWIAPSTFARQTKKYFVREDNLTELLLAAVAEAPLLIYGKSGRLTSNSKDSDQNSNNRSNLIAAPISSVYFDSPSTMCMYKQRLQRLEGAQLFRIRWYGAKKPQGEEHVFLELKTHHEMWIAEQSVKERVTIQERDVCRFLAPSNNWTFDMAQELVLRASPTLSGDKLAQQVELLQRMRHLVVTKQLRPCVRSMYHRVAFQSPDCNALRLTLDRNVTLIDETVGATTTTTTSAKPRIGATPSSWSWSSSSPGSSISSSWCLPDDAVIATDTMMLHVPYSVFEVKLCNPEVMPAVFHGLVDTGTLIEAPKFSKFITGAAAFNASRLTGMLQPYWAEDPPFRELMQKKRNTSASRCGLLEDNSNNNTDNELMRIIACSSNVSSSETTTTHGHSIKATDLHVEVAPDLILADLTSRTSGSPDPNQKEESQTNDTLSSSSMQRSDFLLRRRGPPTEHQQATEESSRSCSKGTGLLGLGFVRTSHKGTCESTIKYAPKKLARVEPKSYFANERTFIQWISASLLLITVSVLLLDFQSVNGVPSTAGLVLNACAIFIILYSTFSYYRRLKLLQKAAPYGYVDHIGPIILGLAVLLGVFTLLYYYITRTAEASSSSSLFAVGTTLTAEPGKCFQHPITGTSSLQYQPSGVVVDKERDLLLVPSLDRITALSTTTPDLPMETLVVIPGSDLEALTYVGDRLFALGEGLKNLALYELGWARPRNSSSPALLVKQQWELETHASSAEGLVYVPDPNDEYGGTLYVAGDNFDPAVPQDRGVVYLYDVPPAFSAETVATTETPTELQRKGILNSNLLNLDLIDAPTGIQLDSKIGDLHYFDGVLYVLHDNAEVIRAWDATSGDLLATMRLPRVSKKFSNRQWEGMALEHNDPTSGIFHPSLRGRRTAAAESSASPSTSLMLHLALDTPPQVWSFAVTASPTSRGSIVFPSCAAAYQ